jgi:hypothetical protein
VPPARAPRLLSNGGMRRPASFREHGMRQDAMIDREDIPVPGFATSSWSPAGVATLHAVGRDSRSALEMGLRAVVALAVAPASTPVDTGRSTPIRGEGNDLGSLFADLVEDLLEQVEFFGAGLHDVTVDGVLRREGGGYVGWGHASGSLEATSPSEIPRLLGSPTANEGATFGVVLHATLQRT